MQLCYYSFPLLHINILNMSYPTANSQEIHKTKQFSRRNSESLPTWSKFQSKHQPNPIKIPNPNNNNRINGFITEQQLLRNHANHQKDPLKLSAPTHNQPYQRDIPINLTSLPYELQKSNLSEKIIKIYSQYFSVEQLPLSRPIDLDPFELINHLFKHISEKLYSQSRQLTDYPLLNYQRQLNQTLKQRLKESEQQVAEIKNKEKFVEKMLAKSEEQLFKYKSQNQQLRVNILVLKKQKQKFNKLMNHQLEAYQKKYELAVTTFKSELSEIGEERDKTKRESWEISHFNKELMEEIDKIKRGMQSEDNYVPKSELVYRNDREYSDIDKSQRSQGIVSQNRSRVNHSRRPTSSRAYSKRKSQKEKNSQFSNPTQQKQLQRQMKDLINNQSNLLDRINQRDNLIEELKSTISILKEKQQGAI